MCDNVNPTVSRSNDKPIVIRKDAPKNAIGRTTIISRQTKIGWQNYANSINKYVYCICQMYRAIIYKYYSLCYFKGKQFFLIIDKNF